MGLIACLLLAVCLCAGEAGASTIWLAQTNGQNMNDPDQWKNSVTSNTMTTERGSWSSSTSDIFQANGKTGIVINADFTAEKISTADEDGAGAGVAGGGFTVSSGPRTITAGLQAGTTQCLLTSGTGYQLDIVGPISAAATGGTARGLNVATALSAVNITGNITAGVALGVYNQSTAPINVSNSTITAGLLIS